VELELDVEAQLVRVHSGTARARILAQDATEFPEIAEPLLEALESDARVSLDVSLVSELARACHAMSKDETRFNLNGVRVSNVENDSGRSERIRWEATDGHRLCRSEPFQCERWPIPEGFEGDTILPSAFAEELARLSSARKPMGKFWHVIQTHHNVVATLERLTLVSRLIEGKFPDTDSVIPQSVSGPQCERLELIGALERILPLCGKNKDLAPKLALEFGQDALYLVAGADSEEGARETVKSDGNGIEGPIGFNAIYLLEALQSFDEQTVALGFVSKDPGLSPARIDGIGAASMCIVMPMRL
jgi:DNA polymerase-3 subunit beta